MGIVRRSVGLVVVAVLGLGLSACLPVEVRHLASDSFAGRNNNSPGGVAARTWLVEQFSQSTVGPVVGQTGDAAYLQPFTDGANVIGVIEGSTYPDQYVLIGAHYDHHGSCGTIGGDNICNGATDNATGTGLVLEMIRRFTQNPPSRSVAFVLWDAEEDGLLGSRYYVDHPVIPLSQTVAYLNLDIQGANLLPSLRTTTFAIGAESGGQALIDAVSSAYAPSTLTGEQLSAVFGLYRSDYASFLNKQIPTVFFSDSTGPCYHTPKDDETVVDWGKLDQQAGVLWRTATALAGTSPSQTLVTPLWESRPFTTWADAVRLRAVIDRSLIDWGRFPQSMIDDINPHLANLDRIISEGAGAYDDTDQGQLLGAASTLVNMMTYGDCDPFLS